MKLKTVDSGPSLTSIEKNQLKVETTPENFVSYCRSVGDEKRINRFMGVHKTLQTAVTPAVEKMTGMGWAG